MLPAITEAAENKWNVSGNVELTVTWKAGEKDFEGTDIIRVKSKNK